MSTDSLQDPWAELRRLQERIARLETASPLENASISRNGIRAVIPGGNDDGDGATKYGHAGGKIGFLLRDGGSWKTIPEWTGEKIAQSHEYPTARITDIEGRMTSAEAGINFTANRATDLEGRAGGLEGRMATAEGGITYTANRVTNVEGRTGSLESRMGSAESAIGTKASQVEMNSKTLTIADIITAYNNHIDTHHAGSPKISS